MHGYVCVYIYSCRNTPSTKEHHLFCVHLLVTPKGSAVYSEASRQAAQRWRAHQAQVTPETIGNDRLTSAEQNRC